MNIRVLVLVALITAFAPLSMDLFLPGLPDLRNDLGASDGAAHLTVTGCIVGWPSASSSPVSCASAWAGNDR
jgi:hypothetical protein